MRRLLAILVLPLLALLFAGCGGSTLDPVAEAASATTKAGSSKVALNASIEAPGLPAAIPFTASGAVDNRARRADLRIDLSRLASVGGQRLGSPADFRGEEILDGLVVYFRLPAFRKGLPGHKQWIKADLAKVSQRQGVNLGQLSQLGQNDPTQMLRYLRATSAGTKKVGEEPVRGVRTTHYRATVDLAKYPNVVPPAQRAQAKAAIDRLIQTSGTHTIPTDVWVDGKGLVRRMHLAYTFRTPSSPQPAKVDMTAELFDFGTRVDVTPPPPSQVVDVTTLAGSSAPAR